jgi:hypothetical protein
MTSSARASTAGGIVRPRAFAVFKLITNSNLVGQKRSQERLQGAIQHEELPTDALADGTWTVALLDSAIRLQ